MTLHLITCVMKLKNLSANEPVRIRFAQERDLALN